MEAVIKESLPPIHELEEALRNGIILAKVAKSFEKELANRKIYEV
jgi:Ras GTPase-activating-like protein IQGAP2/3